MKQSEIENMKFELLKMQHQRLMSDLPDDKNAQALEVEKSMQKVIDFQIMKFQMECRTLGTAWSLMF